MRLVKNQLGKIPKVIRSDGGGEYTSEKLENFYRKEGILLQTSTAYTPQQNGVAERRNRYLQEMTAVMLLGAGLNKTYWGEAVICAAYLQNLCHPTR